MKKRYISAVVFVVAIGATALVSTSGDSKITPIPNVKIPWQNTFTDRFHTLFSGALAIQVQGEINGEAVLHTSYGDISMSSGRVDKILLGSEYWGHKCKVRYEPITATRGDLTLRVGLGSAAGWARHPLLNTEPVNYVGGWTTWYPDRKAKFSQGFFFRGQKKGTWTYWDQRGSILKTEDWEDGRLTQTKTANKVVEFTPLLGSAQGTGGR